MPSSRSVGRISSSGSRLHSEYSVCSALIGWTAWARRIVSGAASESPRKRTLPASTAPPSRRRSPRSARRDRRGAGSRGRCGRRPAAAARRRRPTSTYSGRPLTPAGPRVVGVADDPELGRQHDLVAAVGDRRRRPAARWCAGRRCRRCRARSTPRSSARWMVAIASPSSVDAVELRHPHAAQPLGGDRQVPGFRACAAPSAELSVTRGTALASRHRMPWTLISRPPGPRRLIRVRLPPFQALLDSHGRDVHRFLIATVGRDRRRRLLPGDLAGGAARLSAAARRLQPARLAVHDRPPQGDRPRPRPRRGGRCRSPSRPSWPQAPVADGRRPAGRRGPVVRGGRAAGQAAHGGGAAVHRRLRPTPRSPR